MLSVELVNQFLPSPEILCQFQASPYIAVTRPLYYIMELPVGSLRPEHPVDVQFARVIDDCRLQCRWRLARARRCFAVEERDVENVVLLDHIGKV